MLHNGFFSLFSSFFLKGEQPSDHHGPFLSDGAVDGSCHGNQGPSSQRGERAGSRFLELQRRRYKFTSCRSFELWQLNERQQTVQMSRRVLWLKSLERLPSHCRLQVCGGKSEPDVVLLSAESVNVASVRSVTRVLDAWGKRIFSEIKTLLHSQPSTLLPDYSRYLTWCCNTPPLLMKHGRFSSTIFDYELKRLR